MCPIRFGMSDHRENRDDEQNQHHKHIHNITNKRPTEVGNVAVIKTVVSQDRNHDDLDDHQHQLTQKTGDNLNDSSQHQGCHVDWIGKKFRKELTFGQRVVRRNQRNANHNHQSRQNFVIHAPHTKHPNKLRELPHSDGSIAR